MRVQLKTGSRDILRQVSRKWMDLGSLKNRELIGVLPWARREEVKHGLAEIGDLWVKAEERQKGIGGKLIDHSIIQMQKIFPTFWRNLTKGNVVHRDRR